MDAGGDTSAVSKGAKDLRKGIHALWELEAEPIPFVYIWLMYFLSSIYLLVFVLYVSQFESNPLDELIAAVVVILNNVFVVGLPSVSAGLASAVGPRALSDLSLRRFVTKAMEFTLASKTTPRFEVDEAAEAVLEAKAPPVRSTPMAEFFDAKPEDESLSVEALAANAIMKAVAFAESGLASTKHASDNILQISSGFVGTKIETRLKANSSRTGL